MSSLIRYECRHLHSSIFLQTSSRFSVSLLKYHLNAYVNASFYLFFHALSTRDSRKISCPSPPSAENDIDEVHANVGTTGHQSALFQHTLH